MIPFARYRESADCILERIGDFRPEILLILGSGLGGLADRVGDPIYVPYEEIPSFCCSTAPGHEGRFVFGLLAGKPVAVMQGRVHLYEGYTPEEAGYAVRVARLLGLGTLLVTNACGAVNTGYHPGELMLISDHILLFPCSPLRGENLEEFGPRFPDMSKIYDPKLRQIAKAVAREAGIRLNEGVYMYFPGPQFETPAEIRAAGILGADVAGMSTVPEAITANHCGMKVLGFSLATNMAAGVLDQPLSEAEVFETAEKAKIPFEKLILGCIERV